LLKITATFNTILNSLKHNINVLHTEVEEKIPLIGENVDGGKTMDTQQIYKATLDDTTSDDAKYQEFMKTLADTNISTSIASMASQQMLADDVSRPLTPLSKLKEEDGEEEDEVAASIVPSKSSRIGSGKHSTRPSRITSAKTLSSLMGSMNIAYKDAGETERELSKLDANGNEVEEIDKETIEKDDRKLLHILLENALDNLILAVLAAITISSISEALGNNEAYGKALAQTQELAEDYVSFHLPLEKQLKITGSPTKLNALNSLFSAFDIHLYPTTVQLYNHGVKSLAPSIFSPTIFLTGGYDSLIKIVDLSTEKTLAQYVGHRSAVTEVKFARKDSLILSCSLDRTAKLWSSQTASCEKTFSGHTDGVLTCDMRSDGIVCATGSSDNSIRLWDINTGDCLTILKKHSRWVRVVRFSGDGKYLLSAGLDKRVFVWDVASVIAAGMKNPMHVKSFEPHRDFILAMEIFGTNVFTASKDGTMKMHDWLAGVCLREFDVGPTWGCCLSVSFDGLCVAVGTFDNNVAVFGVKSGDRVRNLRVLNAGINGVVWNRGLAEVVCATADGKIQLVAL